MPNKPRIDPNDPAVQEKIRRGPHEYVRGDGVHGIYVTRPAKELEYPKMLDNTTCPTRRQFKTEPEFNEAVEDWKRQTDSSIVHNKEEERAWHAARKATNQQAKSA